MQVLDDIYSMANLTSNADFILVFESQCSHKRLMQEGFSRAMPFRFISISGGGIPGWSTRKFIEILSTVVPTAPILFFGDFDVGATRIFFNYKFGTKRGANSPARTSLPKMQFMGLTSDDYYGFDESDLIDISEEEFQLIGKELKKIWVLNEDDVRTNLVVR